MRGLLIIIAVATSTFAMFMVIIASKRWNERIRSAARVEALRAMVTVLPMESEPLMEAEFAPAAAAPPQRRRPRTNDDWNDVVDQLWGQSLEPRS